MTAAGSMTGASGTDGGTVRLGAGAGFAGDRIDPAVELARHGELDYLVFECLGERTVAAAQVRRLADPSGGYDSLLAARMRAVLPVLAAGAVAGTRSRTGRHTRIVTNSGAANPLAAGRRTAAVARELGLSARVGVVTGDDVLDVVRRLDPVVWETGEPLSAAPEELVSANAYLGADGVRRALDEDADVVVTGRVADPALYLGPLLHEFGWAQDDWPTLAAGTVVGHLLECAGQLTGGYFADPGTKPVPGLARLGFPFADVGSDGGARLSKLAGSGGLLTTRTCTEQLLYEVDRPDAYLTPDVTADFTAVRLAADGTDAVRVTGGAGGPRPDDLKVTLGFRGGWQGEGQISYAGPRALARARLAGEIVRERLVNVHGLAADAIGVELIGAGAAFRGLAPETDPLEVRLRVSARASGAEQADAVGWEVESLYTNGPAGGGGARKSAQETVLVRSCLVPRDLVASSVTVLEA
ncbi:acyclic terpene utilization AtuA family protein [Promicromonospora panici]|uniref:acyclic terpene utilization AtuA family protein n=1 Tax=Promicromonospora panici TaxID=2219658 RepID=UPI002414030C|nr:acyclic terpene utilization AtuA family protein [Promicromonospora panici]